MGWLGHVCGIALGIVLATATSACGGSAPLPPSATHMQSLLEGEWFPEMPKDKLRSILMTELALQTPPDEATFSKMLPTLQEHDAFAKIVKTRHDDFNSKEIDELRKKVREFEDTSVKVTASRIYMKDESDGTRKYYFYRLKEEDVNNITIFLKGELVEWRFSDHNHVTMVTGAESQPLIRREGLIAEASK